MRWSVIGAGGIARRRTIPGLVGDEGSRLCAVMDMNPEAAQAVGEEYGVPSFTDVKEMLSTVSCDAVYIATPVPCHLEQMKAALDAGCHVLVEKPITVGAEEGQAMLEAFRAAGKHLDVGYMMKYHSLHEKMKDIIQSGGVGAVTSVHMHFSCWYPDIPGAWRQKKEAGGGAVMDLGVHCLELAGWLLEDDIVDVKSFCDTQTFNYEVEDAAVMVFRTKKGVLGTVRVHFNVPDAASLSVVDVYGTAGCMSAKGTLGQEDGGQLSHLYAPQGEYDAAQQRTTNEAVTYTAAGDNLYTKQIAAFRCAAQQGVPAYGNARQAVNVQTLVEKIYKDNT